MKEIKKEIFKAYDIRGLYPEEIDLELAGKIARGFACFLKDDLQTQPLAKIAVAQDMRVSSPFLAKEIIRGLVESGFNVIDLGKVSTPAFYYVVSFRDLAGGVMVTASHNPKQYNGFKFVGAKSKPIAGGSGMEQIRDYVLEDRQLKPEKKGQVEEYNEATRDYVKQDLSYINIGKIKKFKIVADPANCMGATYLDEFFEIVPCEPTRINWELNGNMPVHEANPLKEETLQQLKEVVKNEEADLGIAPDGDGDRIAFLDERGEVIPAHIVTGLVSKLLLKKYPGSKIGYDLRMSKVAKEMIEESGGEAIEVMVGHSLIKALMTERDVLFAGELSMHYYFRENYNCESPVFVLAQMLLIRSLIDKPFSEIVKKFKPYSHSGEINFEVQDKLAVLDMLEKKYSDGQINRLDGLKVTFSDWWFNARLSNTEPLLRLNLEADTKELMDEKLKEISDLISKN